MEVQLDLPPSQGMHPADIVAAVKKRGTNMRQLGLANGFAGSTLTSSLHRRHPKAQRLIAETIGVPMHLIWPYWFSDAAGSRAAGENRRPPVSHETAARVESSSKPAAA